MVAGAIVGRTGAVHWAQPCLVSTHVSIPRDVRRGARESDRRAKHLISHESDKHEGWLEKGKLDSDRELNGLLCVQLNVQGGHNNLSQMFMHIYAFMSDCGKDCGVTGG